MPFDPKDVQENKVVAAIGYLFVLCFVPLLGARDSAFAQTHGRQGLALAMYGIFVFLFDAILGWIPIIGWFFAIIFSIVWLVLTVTGMFKALQGKVWEVPYIGKYFKNVSF